MKRTAFSDTLLIPFFRRTISLLSLFLLAFFAAQAQSVLVSGVIKNAKGEPLRGVSVNIKGATGGTTTNDQGAFNITVPNRSAVLVISYVGYATKEETVGAQTEFNIVLTEGNSALDEVVVIGYGGTMKKRDLAGSISSVAAKDIRERQPVTLFDAIQGKAAGVLVTNDNGDPAGQGTIQIRGASTVNSGNGPLYVIDGIISDNGNYVNPADIESIEILKDAASSAIYGARGANGVILITTKRGKSGRPQVNVQYNYMVGKLAHKLRTTSAEELRYYRNMRAGGDDFNGGANADSVNPYLNADNDYQDLLFRTANKQIASVSISGGKEGLNYYGSLNYTDDQSIVINSWMKRIQSKINVGYQATKRLSVSHALVFAWQTGNNVPIGNTAKQVFERNPWTSIYRPDGSLASYVESKRNPVAFAMLNKDVDNNYIVQFNTTVNYQILPELKFSTLFNVQHINNTNKTFMPAALTSGGTGDATGSNVFNKDFYWEYQAYLNYKKTFGEDHEVTGLLGFSADRRREDGYEIAMFNYLSEEINTSNAGVIDLKKTFTDAAAWANASLFGRLGYNFKGRYIFQGTVRRDGSSRFGPRNKWGNFFSGSVAWRFSDEKFMDWASGVLQDGKLRFSVGQAGNDRIGNYSSYSLMEFGQQYYNGQSAAAESVTLGNAGIKWETTTTTNLGIDLSFLRGRLNFTADYYVKQTKDLLYDARLAKESGKSSVTINLGDIENTGLEFTLSGTPIATKNITWELSGNISFQRGKIKKLANGTPLIEGKWLIREGGRIGDFYIWENLGVYQWDESNAYDQNGVKLTPVIGDNGKPNGTYVDAGGKAYTGTVYSKSRNGKLKGGDTEWRDVNNDNVIDDRDKVIFGNAIPDYYFGITTTFRYKNWSLNVLVNGQIGNEIYNKVRNDQNTNSSTYSPPIWDAIANSWWKPGDIAKYPYFPDKDTRGSISPGYNSLYVEDGSFIRLSSMRLNYQFKPELMKRLKMSNASVFLYGSNLLTWTNYSWYDPEFSSNGLTIGEDGGKYPKRREVGAGINVNF